MSVPHDLDKNQDTLPLDVNAQTGGVGLNGGGKGCIVFHSQGNNSMFDTKSFVLTKQQSIDPLLKHIHINKCSFKERLPISSYFQQTDDKKSVIKVIEKGFKILRYFYTLFLTGLH